MNELRDAAILIVRGAGDIVRRAYHGEVRVEHKGTVDLVTDADRASEEHILGAIAREFPDHAVLAEESGGAGDEGPYRWVIDPLDGTVNFAHRLPHFCVTLAVQERGPAGFETVLGVTLDPLRDELFVAVRGGGATLNERPIHVSSAARLIDAVGATGFAYERLTTSPDNHREFDLLNLVTRGIRRFGSAALDLAYVACGRFDLYWEYALRPWDVMAGALLVSEAGGGVSDPLGRSFDPSWGAMAATNGALHQALVDALAVSRRHPVNSRDAVRALLPPELATQVRDTSEVGREPESA